ncbi:protein-disulfide reductase DsbD [Craterilacuibacter sinensis]|uniref:Thiol:disulfide interchange protein DsbD n=1 Tax=Craterilacuibacter sinensis TaxID=2686017 RepID=A0A845BTB4_9NEIS|nr:protein-disulfide reductase DsbD [Craterilacuibacter sinensis]MXR37406.1 protein-disulfide reductase DsbD [Craterilacuibacter sinensis]
MHTSLFFGRWQTFFFALIVLLGSIFSLPAHALSQDDLLSQEKAFALKAERQGGVVTLNFTVAPGYYLYRERISVASEPPGLIGAAIFPDGKLKDDPYFGLQRIYTGKVAVTVPLLAHAPEALTLKVKLQGCADVGVCYPPDTRTIKLGQSLLPDWLAKPQAPSPADMTDNDLSAQGWLATLSMFFIAGLGMALTACMYPLLPIISSLIAGQGHTLTRQRGFILSFAYVQGLALTYTVIGVIAGLTGSLLTVWLQQPAVILSASLLLVAFALSMFDLYAIQLPAAWQSRLASTSNQLSGGQLATVTLMGMLSALLIGPCVAPPLALALGYIGASGDALLGGAALYMMALGLGLPLVLIGTFGGHILPRAGAWMKVVKAGFGVLMLALALYLATPFLPAFLVLGLWGALAIACAVFLKTFESLPPNAGYRNKLGKALGIVLFLLGAAQLVGMLAGASNPRQPLGFLAGQKADATAAVQPWQDIASVGALDQALIEAQLAGKPVIVDFYADWCVSCKELEEVTFKDPAVVAKLAGFMRLRADVTANNADHQALLKRFGLFGPPGLIVFDAKGKQQPVIVGFVDGPALLQRLP